MCPICVMNSSPSMPSLNSLRHGPGGKYMYGRHCSREEDFNGNSDETLAWLDLSIHDDDKNLHIEDDDLECVIKWIYSNHYEENALCAERVSQMTKTYNDIEAVTRLLEEKERDLELAARIGQSLLEKNKALETRNEELEELVAEATEKVQQLRHEICMKDALLQVYTQDADSESPTDGQLVWNTGLVNMEAVQKKVQALEHENLNLKLETCQLKTETLNYEEKEALLVKDAIKNLAEANDHIKGIQEELGAKTDITLKQQEEITNYMTKVINLEGKIKKATVENAELQSHLNASQEAQRSLTTELAELTEKYHECMALYHEAQEEIKALRRKKGLGVVRQHYSTFSPFLPEGSLASELESSLRSELPYPEGYSPGERRSHNKRIMDTAKYVRKTRKSGSLLSIPGSNHSTSGNDSCESIAGSSNRSSLYLSEGESAMSDGAENETINSFALGRPGIPGSNDLETALRRLSMRKANEINERNFKEEEEMREMQRHDGISTPTPCRTPESMLSTGSGISDLSRMSGYSAMAFRIPEKLQIVKPMEGSATLHQWQRLATPHLGGLLDDRPGVQIKGERKLEMEEEIFMLSDFEEDGMLHANVVDNGVHDENSNHEPGIMTRQQLFHNIRRDSILDGEISDIDTDTDDEVSDNELDFEYTPEIATPAKVPLWLSTPKAVSTKQNRPAKRIQNTSCSVS